jgi:hypothetical protein
MFTPVARTVDSPDLRHTLTELLDADDPLVRLRAKFVLHILDEPGQRVRRNTWQCWLATDRGHS